MRKKKIVAISIGMMLVVTSCSGGGNSITESTPNTTGSEVTNTADAKETNKPDSTETPDTSMNPQETSSVVGEPMPTSGPKDGRFLYVDDDFGFQISFPDYTICRMEGTAFCVQYEERETSSGRPILDKFMAVDKYYDGAMSTGKDKGIENVKTVQDVLENQKFKMEDALRGVLGADVENGEFTQQEPVVINGYDMCKFSGTLHDVIDQFPYSIVGYTILAKGEPIIVFAIDVTEGKTELQSLETELETVIQSFSYPENYTSPLN